METNTATKRQVLQIWLLELLLYKLIRVSFAPIACSALDLDRLPLPKIHEPELSKVKTTHSIFANILQAYKLNAKAKFFVGLIFLLQHFIFTYGLSLSILFGELKECSLKGKEWIYLGHIKFQWLTCIMHSYKFRLKPCD